MINLFLYCLLLTKGIQGYNPQHENVVEECNPFSCHSDWNTWGGDQRLYCDVASGHLPLGGIGLPMLYEGNYDLCETFDDAHFCSFSTSNPMTPLISPIVEIHKLNVSITGGFPYGQFKLDQCVSKSCDLVKLKASFDAQVVEIAKTIGKFLNVSDIDELANTLLKSVAVTCVKPRKNLDIVGVLVVIVISFFALTVLIATLITVYSPYHSIATKLKYFDAAHNYERLVSPIPGDFNVLNGIRVLSMAWVICGHAVLQYIAPIMNPTAESFVTASFSFTLIPGAEYAVDTFFLLSGFLGCWGIINQLSKKKLTIKMYFTLLAARYARLTPTYALVLFGHWKVLPTFATGPYWESTTGQMVQCQNYWWTNMIYLNNLIPAHATGAMDECMGWSWYLANDFQFFLFVPIIAALFLEGKRRSSMIWKYGLPLSLVVNQVISTFFIMLDVGGANDPEFQGRVYVKPWARCSPYIIGIVLACIHYDRLESKKQDWKKLLYPKIYVQAILISALALMVGLILIKYDEWECKDDQHDCKVWFAAFKYGFFSLQNWGKTATAFYYSLGYVVWGVPLATIIYILFCDDQYDIFHIKWFLSGSIFTPLARLTYNSYLVHIPIMMVNSGSRRYAFNWHGFRISLEVIGFIFYAYLGSFILYILIEKPIMNMVSGFLRKKSSATTIEQQQEQQNGYERLEEDQERQ